MRVTPIRFVRNIELANKFYTALGLSENAEATSGTWADLHIRRRTSWTKPSADSSRSKTPTDT
ncbi:hypothetical protein J2808_002410 [Pseudarthrobacter sulfonivorans]|nr:hypothetical protein [Pseudarthrobacter sulfonivorans]